MLSGIEDPTALSIDDLAPRADADDDAEEDDADYIERMTAD